MAEVRRVGGLGVEGDGGVGGKNIALVAFVSAKAQPKILPGIIDAAYGQTLAGVGFTLSVTAGMPCRNCGEDQQQARRYTIARFLRKSSLFHF